MVPVPERLGSARAAVAEVEGDQTARRARLALPGSSVYLTDVPRCRLNVRCARGKNGVVGRL